MRNRGLIASASVLLLAAGIFALGFPVLLGAYDQFGFQIGCGTGFSADLTQASSADTAPDADQHHTTSPAGYRRQCQDALMTRRVWAIPAVAASGVVLTSLTAATVLADMRHRRADRRTGPAVNTRPLR